MSWMPVEDPVVTGDQVRHDQLGAFYDIIELSQEINIKNIIGFLCQQL